MGDGASEANHDDSLELVNLALKGGMITQEQWLDAFAEKTREMKSGMPARNLVEILVSMAYLNREQVAELRERKARGWVVPTADPKDLETTPAYLKTVGPESEPKPFGKFVIHGRLMVDARVKIYEATETAVDRRVALWLLRTTAADHIDAVIRDDERFVKDVEKTTSLSHPNILRVYEAGVIDGRRYIATEFHRGVSMNEWLQGNRTLRQKVELLRDVALAVHHAHEQGVVHQDIRPKNILVDEQGHPRVCNFGLAWTIRGDRETFLTASALAAETVVYMSPEQAVNPSAADQKTDIYALGVILYQIMTGRSPHRGKTAVETLMSKSKDDAPKPSQTGAKGASGVDRNLEKICMRALSKSPTSRPATARELSDDLTAWLKGEKVRGGGCGLRLLVWIGVLAAAGVLAAMLLLLAIRPGAPPADGKGRRSDVSAGAGPGGGFPRRTARIP